MFKLYYLYPEEKKNKETVMLTNLLYLRSKKISSLLLLSCLKKQKENKHIKTKKSSYDIFSRLNLQTYYI